MKRLILLCLLLPSVALAGSITWENDGSDGWDNGDDWDPDNIDEVQEEIDDNDSRITTLESDSTEEIASGTAVMGTSATSANSCATVVTVSATGVATTDVIDFGFNADPTSVTGYGPGASDGLAIYAYPTANNVNFKVCNVTGSSITPGALTLNWRVDR